MSLYDDGFPVSRGTVFVASSSDLFMKIVGEMAASCGLSVVFPLTSEPAWLSVMRTRPSLVICDWDAPAANLAGVIGEAAARHVPLLMAWSRDQQEYYAQGLALPERVAWLTFPVGQDEFRSTVEGLLSPEIDSVHHVSLAVPGVRLGVGVRMRTLSLLA